MTRLLPSVLTGNDLPLSELSAARLDGDVVAFDECFLPTDAADTLLARADALREVVGTRVVADTATALWITGIRSQAPRIHTVAIDRAHRAPYPPSGRVTLHETRLLPGDFGRAGSMRVTTPTRTAYDLTRGNSFGEVECHYLAALLGRSTTASAVRARLAVVPNLPGRHRALERLSRAVAGACGLAPSGDPLIW